MSDSYGSTLREKMKKSMKHPASAKYVSSRRSVVEKYNGDIYAVLIMFALLLLGTLFWITFDGVESCFR